MSRTAHYVIGFGLMLFVAGGGGFLLGALIPNIVVATILSFAWGVSVGMIATPIIIDTAP